MRDNFYRDLSTFDTFGRGWIRRNDETKEQALKLENDETSIEQKNKEVL